MSGGVQVTGLDDFARGMRELERTIPADLERELHEVGGMLVPAMRAAAPKLGGGLAGETKLVRVKGKPAFVNAKPYANARHWGRRKWPNARSPKAVESPVKGVPFVWGTLRGSRALIERELAPRLNRLLSRRLS